MEEKRDMEDKEYGEKKLYRIKQYRIWIGLLVKRLCRQPIYIVLAVMVPLAGYAVGILEGVGSGTALAAVCAEEGTWSDKIISLLSEQEADNALQFVYCDDSSEVERPEVCDPLQGYPIERYSFYF